MKHIGILGGTFDPIHKGHIEIAKSAYEQFDLDEVWFFPSPTPPHKTGRKISDLSDRMEMAKLATKAYPYMRVDDFEESLPSPSYTYQTLEALKRYYPDRVWYFIMGADSLYEFETWKEPARILELAHILVANRSYKDDSLEVEKQRMYLCKKYPKAQISILSYEEIAISAQDLREGIGARMDMRAYVEESVYTYILSKNMYRVD